MQKLRLLAERNSGDAYSEVEDARNANLYKQIGREKLASLSEAFYSRVYGDEGWFRRLFANTTREDAIRSQQEFLAQEFGGPREYEARKGYTALLGRHGPYAIDGKAAARWLELMMLAMADVEINGQDQRFLINYFHHMAYYVLHGCELVNSMRTVGYYKKHDQGEV